MINMPTSSSLSQWPRRPARWRRWAAHPALQMAQPVTFRFGQRALRWGDSGPVVLAMHGWEGRPSQFAALLPALLAAGRQVIAPYGPEHQPGHRGFAHVLVFRQFLLGRAY